MSNFSFGPSRIATRFQIFLASLSLLACATPSALRGLRRWPRHGLNPRPTRPGVRRRNVIPALAIRRP
jgi:hypothetical protein